MAVSALGTVLDDDRFLILHSPLVIFALCHRNDIELIT